MNPSHGAVTNILIYPVKAECAYPGFAYLFMRNPVMRGITTNSSIVLLRFARSAPRRLKPRIDVVADRFYREV